MVRIPCRSVVVAVLPLPVVTLPPNRTAWSCSGDGRSMPDRFSYCLASEREIKTLPRAIFPVGGLIVVVVVAGLPPGVVLGVVVVKVIGGSFLSPVTTDLASAPRKELNS